MKLNKNGARGETWTRTAKKAEGF